MLGMKDFIFITGTSGVGKSTLAQGLLQHYKTTCVEQHMVPEFISRNGIEEMTGELEELTCWENQKAMLLCFNKLGYKNVIAADIDDLRTRDIPIDFEGYHYITIKLVSSDLAQIKEQMKHRPNNGLIDYELQEKCNNKNLARPCLPNECMIDISGMTSEQVLTRAIEIIDTQPVLLNYNYEKPDKSLFYSWVFSNGLR
jgi:cytidylate kinase